MAENEDSVPLTIQLPAWAIAFVKDRAEATCSGVDKVVLEALCLLKERDTLQLMAEGYREMRRVDCDLCEGDMPATCEHMPDW